MVRIRFRIRIKQSDPYQSEKQDPDPYQNRLDPQHWCHRVSGKDYQVFKIRDVAGNL
jgi:hypothetical protein